MEFVFGQLPADGGRHHAIAESNGEGELVRRKESRGAVRQSTATGTLEGPEELRRAHGSQNAGFRTVYAPEVERSHVFQETVAMQGEDRVLPKALGNSHGANELTVVGKIGPEQCELKLF